MPARTTIADMGAVSTAARFTETVRAPVDDTGTAHPHAHHWRIAEATGSTSPGVCRTCGMERLFDNWEKEPDVTPRALPGGSHRQATNAN